MSKLITCLLIIFVFILICIELDIRDTVSKNNACLDTKQVAYYRCGGSKKKPLYCEIKLLNDD